MSTPEADRPVPRAEIDAVNQFAVAGNAEAGIYIFRGVRPIMSQGRALNLAAWLVATADPSQERFGPLLKAVLDIDTRERGVSP